MGNKKLSEDQIIENKMINKISTVGIFGNIVLTLFKLFAGIFAHSGAMVSDAMHSLSDVFATLVAFIGVKVSKKEADKEHPYGHDRLESIASIILALILIGTGVGIGISGIDKIINRNTVAIEVPGMIALVAAVVSIVSKEGMFWYTRHYAKKLNSQAFMADAWHHRSDAISSVGSLIGITFARMGYPIFDPIASVLIALLILKVGYNIFMDGFSRMIDKSCSDEVEEKIRKIVVEQEGVEGIDLLKTREFGSKMYVDIEILADGDQSLRQSHSIAQRVHDEVEKNIPDCKHCMVHVNPTKKDGVDNNKDII
ncbi:MAG: cation diffusion facilitator family transporter [Peptostreptococcus sp.]|uniref:cation diffusion facilitator family transporter n=1 Tax=Peptostreptococcus sp. TaxID=1262 RepID=UPI002FC70467